MAGVPEETVRQAADASLSPAADRHQNLDTPAAAASKAATDQSGKLRIAIATRSPFRTP